MRARLKKKAEGRGGAQPPPRGGLGVGGAPHLQMVVILAGILIHSNSTSRRRSDSRRYSD